MFAAFWIDLRYHAGQLALCVLAIAALGVACVAVDRWRQRRWEKRNRTPPPNE